MDPVLYAFDVGLPVEPEAPEEIVETPVEFAEAA